MNILTEERNTKIIGAIILIAIGVWLLYFIGENLKNEYYRKGLDAGMSYSEYYCYKFNEDEYIGSLKWIEEHDPKLYNEIIDRGL